MRVLGIDPGYDRIGIAVMERVSGKESLLYSDCFETSRQDIFSKRLREMGEEIEAVLKKYQPDTVAVEKLFFNKNQKTALAVAGARGVTIYLAEKYGADVREFGPSEIKVAATGYGKSDKRAVFDMLRRLVPELPPKALDDEYDAIAIALTALAHRR